MKTLHKYGIRIVLGVCGLIILLGTYIFQRLSITEIGFQASTLHPNVIFILNRTVRILLNDLACFLVIYALFNDGRYLQVAFWVFLVEILILFPIYLLIKLGTEGDSEISSPLLSQIHRLIVNPTLMVLLIMGFFYQKYFKK